MKLYFSEVQQLKVMNSIISHEMECMKKEHEQISMELKENKAISDLQQKNFTEVIQKVSSYCIMHQECILHA